MLVKMLVPTILDILSGKEEKTFLIWTKCYCNGLKVTLDRIKEDTFNFWAKTFGKLMASSIEEKLSGLIEKNDLRKLRLN